MKVIAVVFTVVLFCSCGTNMKITGTYTSKSNPDFFQFNPDSTFYYKYNAYHVSEFSSGTWTQTGKKTVLLNSSIQNKNIILKVKQRNDNISKGNILDLDFETDFDLNKYKCLIFINDTLYSLEKADSIVSTGLTSKDFEKEINIADIYFRYIRCDSLSSLKLNTPIRSIFFKIIKLDLNSSYIIRHPLQTEKYVSPLASQYNLKVSMSFNDSLFNYHVFNDEKIKIKRRGIFLFNSNNNSWWFIPKLPDR